RRSRLVPYTTLFRCPGAGGVFALFDHGAARGRGGGGALVMNLAAALMDHEGAAGTGGRHRLQLVLRSAAGDHQPAPDLSAHHARPREHTSALPSREN